MIYRRPNKKTKNPRCREGASTAPQATRHRFPGFDVAHPSEWHIIVLLAVTTVVCLVPFIAKPLNVDDPLFVWAAQGIRQHPFDFYGSPVNWYGWADSMSGVMKNPPLAAYYIAAASLVTGWSEVGLHLAFLLPAIGTVLGTYAIARRLCQRPAWVAMATLLTPVFMVSAATVMCDMLMLCLFVWAIELWMRGIDKSAAGYLMASGLLITLSALTKYFALSLIPLLLVYAVASGRRRRMTAPLLALVGPAIAMAVYQWTTRRLYGRGLLLDAAAYASGWHPADVTSFYAHGLIALVFVGGCAIGVACLSFSTFRPVLWISILLTAFAASWASVNIAHLGLSALTVDAAARWRLVVHLAVFSAAGIALLLVTFRELKRWRDSNSLLICLWVMGTFVFVAFFNWTINGRTILPMVPALAIVIARQFDRMPDRRAVAYARWALLVPAAAVALMVTSADQDWAQAAKDAARTTAERFGHGGGHLWFQGHWGFQVLHAAGGRAAG